VYYNISQCYHVANITYILCLYKKDRLRGDFGILQSGPKGVISKFGDAFWSQVYVYILSMGRDRVRVENIHSFFYAEHAPSMDRNWRGSNPRSIRDRGAIKRYRPDITRTSGTLGDLLTHIPHLIVLNEVTQYTDFTVG